jgi:hypothetical protein
MTITAEKEYEHIGESAGAADHDRDLVHELSKRLDALWRYDQYIANAGDKTRLLAFWKDLRTQERENVGRLKELIAGEVEAGCF